MRSYEIKILFRKEVEGLTAKEKAAAPPHVFRVGDSDSRRATNQVINLLKNTEQISSGREIIVLEARVVG